MSGAIPPLPMHLHVFRGSDFTHFLLCFPSLFLLGYSEFDSIVWEYLVTDIFLIAASSNMKFNVIEQIRGLLKLLYRLKRISVKYCLIYSHQMKTYVLNSVVKSTDADFRNN